MHTTTAAATATQIAQYRAEMEAELWRILSFLQQNAVDETRGGFVGQMDNTGQVNGEAPKGSVLNARILWSFSAAYRHTQDPAQLLLATRAYHYLMQHFVDWEKGGVYWSVDAHGQPLNTRKQVYALAFAIYGLSEFYQVTGEEKALQTCQALFEWIEQYSFDSTYGGYFEALDREGEMLDDMRLSEKDRNDPKTMNTHLHLLEAYASLYRCWPHAALARQLEGLIRLFLDLIVDRKKGHMNLFFSSTWESRSGLVSYGHDIEASWLLLEAAEVLGEADLYAETAALALQMARATAEGLQPDGSLYHELDAAQAHFDTHREWWVSAEAMVGFLNAYQLSGDPLFLKQSLAAWQFAKQHLLDQQGGEWFWGVYDDYSRMKEEDKIGFWKCPYHNSRACLEVMKRCSKLLKKA